IGAEAVPRAAYRVDQAVVAGRLERLAQAPDVHVDRALLHEPLVAPDMVEQLRTGIDAPGVSHEEMQQAELGGRELDALALHADAARRGIEAQPLGLARVAGERGRALPLPRLDARG